MAPFLNFAIPFAFLLAGMALWVVIGGWSGSLAFVACFLVGAYLGKKAFKRLATPEQIRADLEARLHND